MSKPSHALVLDIGTSSIKAFVFDRNYLCIAKSERKLKSHRKGARVEQRPSDFLRLSKVVLQEALAQSKIDSSRMIMGITNQRETVVVWDKQTGVPVYPAIVWQDTRTKKLCASLKKYEILIRSKTGLTLSPYFSATKLSWILNHVQKSRRLNDRQGLICGTIDTWLLWNLLHGNPHQTDSTNASRTLLFNIRTLSWDKKLLKIFTIPETVLPTVYPSQYSYGILREDILGYPIEVGAVCGDQQSSMAAAGLKKGTTKVTYGTGTFVMQSIGGSYLYKKSFFTTLIPHGKKPRYALEAKVDIGGRDVERALTNRKKLKCVLTRIAYSVDACLKKLPLKIKKIFIDGGVTRDGLMGTIQKEISGVSVFPMSTFHGTALGVAKLLLDK